MGLQGYKRYLENEINKELDSKTLLYGELGLKYMIKRDVLGLINFLVYIPIYAGLIYLADSKNIGMETWTNVNITLGLIFLIISIPIFTFSKKIENKSYELAGINPNKIVISKKT